MDPRLAACAAAHGGPFLVRKAIAAGYTEAAIREQCERGVWTRLRHGIYAETELLADPAGDHRVRVAAALLAVGAFDAAASHESAASLHGIALLSPCDEITVTRPYPAPARNRRGVRVHRAALPASHVTRVDGVPVTTPARTVVDLARRVSYRDAVVAADSAMYHLHVTRAQLERVLADCTRWPGSAAAVQVVTAAHPKARSPLETLGRLMCAEHGLPVPQVGPYIGDDEPYAEADLYWRECKVIVLLDGMLKYGNTPWQNRREKLTQERLENDGFIVVRLT